MQSRSSPSISNCIFLHHIFEIKTNKVHQALDGRSIEVTTVVELSLGGRKGGRLLRSNLQLFCTIVSGPWLLAA